MEQITIIHSTQDGLVANVSKLLADQSVNIESLHAMSILDRSVVVLTVDRFEDAVRLINEAGYETICDEVIHLTIKDTPGSLACIANRLFDQGIHIRSIRQVARGFGEATVAIAMDNITDCTELIEDLLLEFQA